MPTKAGAISSPRCMRRMMVAFLSLVLLLGSAFLPIVSTLSTTTSVNTDRTKPCVVRDHLTPPIVSPAEPTEGDGDDDPSQLWPASSVVRLEFSSSSLRATNDRHAASTVLLTRRDGLDLYGRPVVHEEDDARTATLTFLEQSDDESPPSSNNERNNDLWDATLVIRPDREGTAIKESSGTPWRPFAQSASVSSNKSCFVAMNRFEVKDECRALFEERWARRNSKLSHQPGLVGFSLLRRRPRSSSSNSATCCDRFNYSTCTIWKSIDDWKRWRTGGGRTSHEASRVANTRRVSVAEWLEGPAAPIFFDGRILAGATESGEGRGP